MYTNKAKISKSVAVSATADGSLNKINRSSVKPMSAVELDSLAESSAAGIREYNETLTLQFYFGMVDSAIVDAFAEDELIHDFIKENGKHYTPTEISEKAVAVKTLLPHLGKTDKTACRRLVRTDQLDCQNGWDCHFAGLTESRKVSSKMTVQGMVKGMKEASPDLFPKVTPRAAKPKVGDSNTKDLAEIANLKLEKLNFRGHVRAVLKPLMAWAEEYPEDMAELVKLYEECKKG